MSGARHHPQQRQHALIRSQRLQLDVRQVRHRPGQVLDLLRLPHSRLAERNRRELHNLVAVEVHQLRDVFLPSVGLGAVYGWLVW